MQDSTMGMRAVRRIRALSRIAERTDHDTWNHTFRINLCSGVVARRMSLPGDVCRHIGLMSQMHDVGKLRIDPSILLKPGELTSGEFEQVKLHPQLGAEIVGGERDLRMARAIALTHHERWDGSGYPNGIEGRQIPIVGRIVALADVYDALRSRRPYKPALSHEESLKIILKGSERTRPEHFDPEVLEAFRQHHGDLDSIFCAYRDRRTQPRLGDGLAA